MPCGYAREISALQVERAPDGAADELVSTLRPVGLLLD